MDNENAAPPGLRETKARRGIHTFACPSFTNPEGAEWHPRVDLRTGRFECDCPDWTYRKSKTDEPCKHVRAALAALEQSGRVPGNSDVPKAVKQLLMDFPLRLTDVLRAAIAAVGLATVLDTIGELFGNAGQEGRRKRRRRR